MLYETLVVYRRHLIHLKQYHQYCLRKRLGINWKTAINDVEILERSESRSVESMILQSRLSWDGDLVGKNDGRLLK